MLFNIAPTNAERARRAFTAEPITHAHGYTNGAILRPKNPRLSFYYEIATLEKFNLIICTVRHKEVNTIEAVISLSDYTPDSIEVRQGELYRNCSNYPYRTETNPRYLKKYDQIACIVHGAITAGLLFDEEQPETAPEPTQVEQATPDAEKAENEPKKGILTSTEAAPAYIVQCKGTRGSWTDYSSPATLAECETIKARAEARRTCDIYGNILLYRIIPTEATQTQMETTGAPEEIQTPMEDGRPAPAADSQTPMEPAGDRQTVMDGGKAGQPADGQTPMDGGKAGARQTVMEGPEKGRNKPDKAAPLQTTTHNGNSPKCAKNPPYTAPPELSTIYTRGSPIPIQNLTAPWTGCGKLDRHPFSMWKK